MAVIERAMDEKRKTSRTAESPIDSSMKEYRTVKVATKTGVRTVRVRKDRLDKSYGKLSYKKQEVYAKKVKIETDEGTTTKAINPKILAKRYTQVPNTNRFKKYEKKNLVTIETTHGRKIVTEEQLKYTYKKRGKKYERTGVYREKRRPSRVKTVEEGRIPIGYQMVVIFDVVVINPDGTPGRRVDGVYGYSSVNRIPRSPDEMFPEAYSSMKKRLAEDHNVRYDADISYTIVDTEYSFYVS